MADVSPSELGRRISHLNSVEVELLTARHGDDIDLIGSLYLKRAEAARLVAIALDVDTSAPYWGINQASINMAQSYARVGADLHSARSVRQR